MLKKEESLVIALDDGEMWSSDGYVVVYNNDKIRQHHGDYLIDEEDDRRGSQQPNAHQVLEELRLGDIDDECISETYYIEELLTFYLTAKRMGLDSIIEDVA